MRNPSTWILITLIAYLAACSDPASPQGNNPSATAPEQTRDEPAEGTAPVVVDAIRAMAEREGIFIGKVPEGFPADILPIHPQGKVDKSATTGGTITLLQHVSDDRAAVLTWYTDYYRDAGWSPSEPMTFGNRMMTGFLAGDARIDMTLTPQDEGQTFVSLALSER